MNNIVFLSGLSNTLVQWKSHLADVDGWERHAVLTSRERRDRSLKVFAHVNAENAEVYRRIMEVFARAKATFLLHLRPEEVCSTLREVHGVNADVESIKDSLRQLCEWGNLEAHQDTSDVQSLEEFNRARLLYQMTHEGEAAERALGFFQEQLLRTGELQTAALSDIRELLEELAALLEETPTDDGKVYRTLLALCARFDELTQRAQTFLSSLQKMIHLHGIDIDAFLAYKQTLIDYLERFIGELVLVSAPIAAGLERVDGAAGARLFRLAAERELIDALDSQAADLASTEGRWRERWRGLESWFLGHSGQLSQAERLRARARAAIPALLAAVAAIHDRRVARSDRWQDYRALARWFAAAPTDADAHRLWRAAFALSPARHLTVDGQTLARWDQKAVPAQTSWLAAEPMAIAPKLRATGRHRAQRRPNNVIDRSKEKRQLFVQAQQEAAQIERARQRLLGDKPARLSQLGTLDANEFSLFLTLLGDALSRKVDEADAVLATSSDGSLLIRLEPILDGSQAMIRTPAGVFHGPDHLWHVWPAWDESPFEQRAACNGGER